jgi:fructokinase
MRNRLSAVGIGSFGPLDLDPRSETYGYITSTPKLAWQNYDFAGAIARILNVPVAFDTDVNAAAIAEGHCGGAQDVEDFIYLTVGTGIGGAAVVNGRLVHGLMHPEMGHIRLPHDVTQDPFAGECPYHKDCLEGLASGSAIKERWGKPAHDLPPDHSAWVLEAHYLALALATWVCTLSPKRIVIGGGVMQRTFLFPMIRRELRDLLNNYIPKRALIEELDKFIVPPQLGNHSGVLGAILLAKELYLKGSAI